MSHGMVCLRLSHFRRDLVQVAQGQTLPETRLGIRAAAQHSRHRPAGAQHVHFDGKFLFSCRWPGEMRMDLGSFWNSARYPGPRGKASCLRAQATIL